MLNIKAKNNHPKLIRLKNRIQNEGYFKNKEWLLDKIKQHEQTTEAL
jgi:hypothetical protein